MPQFNDYPLRASKVAVIGLDCAPAGLVLDELASGLPVLSGLAQRGFAGVLRSITPPITVPAWSCMLSGYDPGELGIYGFRNRVDYSYDALAVADSNSVTVPRVWDHLGRAGKRSILLGVPQTYPPPEVRGLVVSDFLAPDKKVRFTRPGWVQERLDEWAGGNYLLDVSGFRGGDKARILADIHAMTGARFKVAGKLLQEQWDFFMLVEMGPDRLHHAFWRYHDPGHRLHEQDSPYVSAMRKYYQRLDGLTGEFIDGLPEGTLILVVSDHGAQVMQGGLAINQWLINEGYLVLKESSASGNLEPHMVDWPRNKAWSSGGYYARIFLNVAGREPQGAVQPEEVEALKAELRSKLTAMTDPLGQPLGNQVFVPEELYRTVNGIAPDLILLPGGLSWRAIGSVGLDSIYSFSNDTGPDDANHHPDGLLIAALKGKDLPTPPEGRLLSSPTDIRQVAPTILAAMGVEPKTPSAPINPWLAD
jgi:predicted AlkP superfamily phosphohydrolase/phosphomutase